MREQICVLLFLVAAILSTTVLGSYKFLKSKGKRDDLFARFFSKTIFIDVIPWYGFLHLVLILSVFQGNQNIVYIYI